MRLGILSDSHGYAARTRLAVRALLDHGAETLIHLGDICGEDVLDELVGHDARIVFGNCDWDERSMSSYAANVGIIVEHPMGRLRSDSGREVAFTHGDRPTLMNAALAEGVAYLLHGHTHTPRDQRLGPTRVINPGALHRAARYTVACLDPDADTLEFIEIPRDG